MQLVLSNCANPSKERKHRQHHHKNTIESILHAKPFFSFETCPERNTWYTLFDSIYTQIKPICKDNKCKDNQCIVECDQRDSIYLLDVYEGLQHNLIDVNLAKWFLRSYRSYLVQILKKVDKKNKCK